MQKSLKILVVRFSSIGDIVLTTPVVRVLKKQINAEVHFLSFSKYSNLLLHNPYIDKVYTIDGKEINNGKTILYNEDSALSFIRPKTEGIYIIHLLSDSFELNQKFIVLE